MRKPFFAAVLLAAGTMLVANATAQQTPAATTPKTQEAAAGAKASSSGTAPEKKPESPFKSRKEKFSYALGMNIGSGLGANLKKQSVEFDPKLVAEGLKDTLTDSKTLLTQDEAQAVLKEVQMAVQKEQQEKMHQAADKNKSEGEAFLAANKGKEGVVALPSGMQYKIVTEGTGPKPTASDTVVCNYRGTLIDGKEFDSSFKRKEPAKFPVSGVIKGWTEALQLMPVGSKWQLFIPPNLAYGEQGVGADIQPNSTLIFEVELLSIEPKKDQDKPKAEKMEDENDQKAADQKSEEKKPDQQ
jgi:FKBP-type peptidyl-prolyl cis-trans isomerase